jgi:hypothetical protein
MHWSKWLLAKETPLTEVHACNALLGNGACLATHLSEKLASLTVLQEGQPFAPRLTPLPKVPGVQGMQTLGGSSGKPWGPPKPAPQTVKYIG